MKSRLFWKIFLPFWILQTCIMLFLAFRVHASFGPDRPWWVQPERRAMPVLARYPPGAIPKADRMASANSFMASP